MPGELQVPLWEWWIVFYFFVGGIAGGAYFTAALVELVGEPEDRPIARMGYLIAFPLALLCAVFLILDLGVPLRFWHMLVYSRTLLPWPKWDSAISVGAYALGFFGLFSFLSFLDILVETGRLPWAPLRARYTRVPRMIYATLGAIVGFFLASYTGVLIATTQLPMWAGTPLLGGLFVASGASTGMAAIGLGLAVTNLRLAPRSLAKLQRAETAAMIIEIVLLVLFLVLVTSQGFTWTLGTVLLLVGGSLIIGLVVPLALQLTGARGGAHGTVAAVSLVALLVLLGGFLLRTAIVMGGQGLI